MAGEVGDKPAVRQITQFARQAQYLSERENPYYSSTFKATMRYVPLAMRLYRAKFYYDMECDWSGFPIESGAAIRSGLAKENEAYVKRMAPKKYWEALIPKSEIGCKRKVLDTEYLKCLWRDNVELLPNDPVQRITEDGVVTKSGREVRADAIVLAIGFATQQMLCPMEIVGKGGLKLNDYVSISRVICNEGNRLIGPTVEQQDSRRSPSLLRHRTAKLRKLLRPDGTQHCHRPFERHLHRRVPDKLHSAVA